MASALRKVDEEIEAKNKRSPSEVSSTKDVEESTTDSWPFRKSKTTVDAVSSKLNAVSLKLQPDAEEYKMDHQRRGVALIFNHIHFTNMSTRYGTVKDCKDMEVTLIDLGFEVRVYNDPKMSTINAVLKQTAAEDHSDADCLVVVAMSHGESGMLHSGDVLYPVGTLWNPFTGDECATLVGKPKLFFIQACRGERLDKGVKIIHETDSSTPSYTVPAYADILVAYSTYDGFYSWRNPDAGAWFIQAICHEFKLNGRKRDLLTILTFVNRRVAVEYQSYVPHNAKLNEKKQIPSVVTMLTRLVYFRDKKSVDYGENDVRAVENKGRDSLGHTEMESSSSSGAGRKLCEVQ